MIRKAELGDLGTIMTIYQRAREFMRSKGNYSQWINGYPSKELLVSDIEKGYLYIAEDDDGIFAVFAFIIGEDKTYKYIEGSWLSDEQYGTIHRVASDGTKSRVLDLVVRYCSSVIEHLRIDTHKDNGVMQKAVLRNGFQHCGTIYVEDGSPRLAYEKLAIKEEPKGVL